MAAVYPVLYILFPRFILKRKYVQFFLWALILLVISGTLGHLMWSSEYEDATTTMRLLMILSQIMIFGLYCGR